MNWEDWKTVILDFLIFVVPRVLAAWMAIWFVVQITH